MNLLETIEAAAGGSIMREIGGSVGIPASQARPAIEQLLPALARGIQRNAAQPGGLDSLLGALKSGSHQRYVDHPEELTRPGAIQDGNAILGHILGSKDVSRNVAGRAAAETGVAPELLKKMLPMLAAAVMGSLGKQTSGGGGLSSLAGAGSGGGGDLGGMLSAATQAEREKAILVAGNTAGIAKVEDAVEVAASEPASTYYEVKKGDSLSKIAKAHYGDAMKYPQIFEANKPMLKDPDKIYPGQVLRLPPL